MLSLPIDIVIGLSIYLSVKHSNKNRTAIKTLLQNPAADIYCSVKTAENNVVVHITEEKSFSRGDGQKVV